MSFKLADTEQIYSLTPELKKQDVTTIFEWLKSQQHLPELTELQVILFLHSCYCDIEKTKKTIDNYLTLLAESSLFRLPAEEVIRRTMSVIFTGMLPQRTPAGDAIFLLKLLDMSPEKYVFSDLTKVMTMIMLLDFYQHGPANGLIILIDCKGTSWKHLGRIGTSAIKQFSYFSQEAAPVRIKGTHYVNMVPPFSHLMALTKPFVRNEIFDSIKIHSDFESLCEQIPKECLPEDYGGKLSSMGQLNDENRENLIKNLDFFKWHVTQKVDESKRAEKVQKDGAILRCFGVS